MSKTQDIRNLFEDVVVDILKGRVLVTKEGDPVITEDGRVAVERPPAADLSVVRAYLKDQEQPKGNELPKTGQPTGALEAYVRKAGKSLPFAGPSTTQ